MREKVREYCPYCIERGFTSIGHSRALSIDTATGQYYCFRCGAFGAKSKIATALTIVPEKKKKADLSLDFLSFSLMLPQMKPVFEYALSRLPEDVVLDKCRWSPQLPDRLIFPVWDNEGRVIYWQARAIYSKKVCEEQNILRFLTSQQPNSCIYNYDPAKKWACLVEGPIDALSTPNGICTFGHYLTKAHKSVIISTYEYLFWCYDGDLRDKTGPAFKHIDEAKKEIKEYIPIYEILLPPDKDPNDLGFNEMEKLIKSVARHHGLKI